MRARALMTIITAGVAPIAACSPVPARRFRRFDEGALASGAARLVLLYRVEGGIAQRLNNTDGCYVPVHRVARLIV